MTTEITGQTTMLPVDTEALVRRAVQQLEEASKALVAANQERQAAHAAYQEALERHFMATINQPEPTDPEQDAAA